MTKKQRARLDRNRESQRMALREHFGAGDFENKPAPPKRRTARGLRESQSDERLPRGINRHMHNVEVNPLGQMRMWYTPNIIK